MVNISKDSFERLSFGFTVKDIKAIFKIPYYYYKALCVNFIK